MLRQANFACRKEKSCNISVILLVPLPVYNLWHINAIFADIFVMLIKFVVHFLNYRCGFVAERGNELQCIFYKVIAVNMVLHTHIKGRGDGALFNVAAHVQVAVVAAVSKEG